MGVTRSERERQWSGVKNRNFASEESPLKIEGNCEHSNLNHRTIPWHCGTRFQTYAWIMFGFVVLASHDNILFPKEDLIAFTWQLCLTIAQRTPDILSFA
jgi:hypothetical protein